MDDCPLSQVVEHLSGDEKRRYVEKVKAVGAGDPYLLPQRVFSPVLTAAAAAAGAVISAEIPIVTFGDVYSYLINRSSSYTQESLKAYKSLDAYKYFVSGFVHDVLITKASTKTFIVLAKVNIAYTTIFCLFIFDFRELSVFELSVSFIFLLIGYNYMDYQECFQCQVIIWHCV